MHIRRLLTAAAAVLFVGYGSVAALGQEEGGQTSPESRLLSDYELDRLVAPIALYPDSLIAQILPASAYPVEVVEASRWAAKRRGLSPAAQSSALEQQDWDVSVKALVYFPRVLDMLNDKLEWTRELGDAFVNQEQDVMDAIQRMRTKAQAAGRLRSTREQRVIVEERIIRIVPADPQVVYVPVYDPEVVYVSRPYGYSAADVAAAQFVSFSVGVVIGSYWDRWHDYDCDWRRRYVWHHHRRPQDHWKRPHHNGRDHRDGAPWKPDWRRRRHHGSRDRVYGNPATPPARHQRPAAFGGATAPHSVNRGRTLGAPRREKPASGGITIDHKRPARRESGHANAAEPSRKVDLPGSRRAPQRVAPPQRPPRTPDLERPRRREQNGRGFGEVVRQPRRDQEIRFTPPPRRRIEEPARPRRSDSAERGRRVERPREENRAPRQDRRRIERVERPSPSAPRERRRDDSDGKERRKKKH